MLRGRSIFLASSRAFSHQLTRLSLPDGLTGSGLLARRGWRWWISRRILWLVLLLFGRRKCDAMYVWRGENVLDRFVESLSAHLASTGKDLLSVSAETDLSAIRKKLQENGFETREVLRRRIPGETIYVYECTLAVR